MNPRTRRMIKSGIMQQLLGEKENKKSGLQEAVKEVNSHTAKPEPKEVKQPAIEEAPLVDVPTVQEDVVDEVNPVMDSFIADELKEIERISPVKSKKTTVKKTTTKSKKKVTK